MKEETIMNTTSWLVVEFEGEGPHPYKLIQIHIEVGKKEEKGSKKNIQSIKLDRKKSWFTYLDPLLVACSKCLFLVARKRRDEIVHIVCKKKSTPRPFSDTKTPYHLSTSSGLDSNNRSQVLLLLMIKFHLHLHKHILKLNTPRSTSIPIPDNSQDLTVVVGEVEDVEVEVVEVVPILSSNAGGDPSTLLFLLSGSLLEQKW